MPKNGSATMYTSGWPKNQNRCCQSMPPPFSLLKMSAPRCRSASSAKNAEVRAGKATRMRMLVTKMDQVKMGIRNIVMPGARRQTIVVSMLTAPRIVPRPATIRPLIQRLAPAPGVCAAVDSGAYAYQPKSGAPAGVTNEAIKIKEPNRYSQYEKLLSRGKATSGAPICRGRTRLEKPKTRGV